MDTFVSSASAHVFSMSELEPRYDFDIAGFADRLAEAMAPEKPTAFARRAGIPQTVLSKYLRGAMVGPRLDIVAQMADALGVTLDWLAFGRGDGSAGDTVRVPRYDAALAAGAGSWNEGKAKLDDVPFTSTFFQKRLGRATGSGFAVLEAAGDSMEPTISSGDLLLIDETATRLTDAIFGFVLDGEARVKRVRKLIDGISIISDNPAYPAEEVRGDRLAALQVIGRVRWIGRVM